MLPIFMKCTKMTIRHTTIFKAILDNYDEDLAAIRDKYRKTT